MILGPNSDETQMDVIEYSMTNSILDIIGENLLKFTD